MCVACVRTVLSIIHTGIIVRMRVYAIVGVRGGRAMRLVTHSVDYDVHLHYSNVSSCWSVSAGNLPFMLFSRLALTAALSAVLSFPLTSGGCCYAGIGLGCMAGTGSVPPGGTGAGCKCWWG